MPNLFDSLTIKSVTLRDPHWPLRAARALNARPPSSPVQYGRAW